MVKAVRESKGGAPAHSPGPWERPQPWLPGAAGKQCPRWEELHFSGAGGGNSEKAEGKEDFACS